MIDASENCRGISKTLKPIFCRVLPSPSSKRTCYGRPLKSNVCAAHGTNPAGCKSRHQVSAEPKVSQRASASLRGGVRRKPKTKSRGDEQKSDMRRDASGASGHVTTKPSICKAGGNAGVGAFCKSGACARKDSCLTAGDLHGVSGNRNWAAGNRC